MRFKHVTHLSVFFCISLGTHLYIQVIVTFLKFCLYTQGQILFHLFDVQTDLQILFCPFQVLKVHQCTTFTTHHHLSLKTESLKSKEQMEDPPIFCINCFSRTWAGRNRTYSLKFTFTPNGWNGIRPYFIWPLFYRILRRRYSYAGEHQNKKLEENKESRRQES